MTADSSFEFGFSIHNAGWNTYRAIEMDQQLDWIAQSGATLVRVDAMPNEWEKPWMDAMVAKARARGLDLMVILYGGTKEEGLDMARRYRGEIKYYQVSNEEDCKAILGAHVDGEILEDYHIEKLDDFVVRAKASIEGIRLGDPQAKIVINHTWIHHGMLRYILDHGVEFDLIGLDWYSMMEKYPGGITAYLEKLMELFGKEVILCESNILGDYAGGSDERQADYVEGLINRVRAFAARDSRLKGQVFYELLDEPELGNQEGHFGFIRVREDLVPEGPKEAYYRIQKLLMPQA